ncbi:MAG: adenylate/guanylate cyclase domain-containing protein [Ramlibacter sp.]
MTQPPAARRTSILVVEDDAATRNQIARLLRLQGYGTLEAADGAAALDALRRGGVAAVISDVTMPGIDGFELVAAIRADAALAATPVVLLTALGDRASMRRGMTAGADDYLAKPFAPEELVQALAGVLEKKARMEDSIELAVRERVAVLRRQAAAGARLRGDEYGLQPEAGAVVDRQVHATVLFADIRNFTAVAEQLGSGGVAELLAAYFEHACRPVLANGGVYVRFIGDGLMSLFVDGPEPVPPARRAVAAALGIALAAHEFRSWVEQHFAGLPPFAIGIGLHSGEVTLCRLGSDDSAEITPIGDSVNVAARLEAASKELGWTVVASRAVLEDAGAGVQTGGAAALALRGRSEDIRVHEVTGLLTGPQEQLLGFPSLDARGPAMRTAVAVNSALAAQAPDGSPITVVAGPTHSPRGH